METVKGVSFVKHKARRNVPLCCLLREAGLNTNKSGPSKGLQWAAEEKLISKNHEEFNCYLPEGTRSTFLMVFSPDGKMIASTHGNHNVYVTDLTNGRNVKTLTGHPRTPWCIAFHPSSNQILASGCLGGQVRVWDLHGGSEIWTADSQTVIASLAFHPTDRVLVIASYNEIHFWDWSQQKPFAKCCTSNEREKVRYVAFDGLGEKLVTGIANAPPRIQSQWDRVSAPQPPPQLSQAEHERRITICYRYMVEQYEQLVERYYRLSNGSGPSGSQPVGRRRSPHTIDRGTDPMEPAEDRTQRCSVCRRSNFTDTTEPGPSLVTEMLRRHVHAINEGSSPSSSQAVSEGSAESSQGSSQRTHLTVRANYLYERLARLRSQVETGRTILARTRTAAAAMSARMSPSAPEDANYLIDSLQTRNSAERTDDSPNSSQLLMLPEPLVPLETVEDRPSIISRIGSFLTRRRNGRVSDSSSSDTSVSDSSPAWHRPLTPPPSQRLRLTNLVCPTSRQVIFDPVPPESSPDCPPPHLDLNSFSDPPFSPGGSSIPTLGSLASALSQIASRHIASGGARQSSTNPPIRTAYSLGSNNTRRHISTNTSSPASTNTSSPVSTNTSSHVSTNTSSHVSTNTPSHVSTNTPHDPLPPQPAHRRPVPRWVQSPEIQPVSTPSSRSLSELTNGSDSDADSVFLRQNIDNNFSHWRVFLRYRYFRDSGSNTEPPSESNSSDSNSSRLRRNCESSSAMARMRAQFRRLQSVYNTRDREPHLLRVAAENAERRLLLRLTNLFQRPFPSTSSNDSSFQPPTGNSADLASVRFGLELLGRHIDNLSRQCSRLRLESGEMRRMWQELEPRIFTLHGAVRDWPPVVRVSPGNEVDAEGVASTSSLPTDEDSEDSGLLLTQRRHYGTRRFRYLHRPAYKRPRFDRFRLPRRYPQGPCADDDSDDNDDDGSVSRQSESSDADSAHGVKRKSMCDQSPSTSNDTPRIPARVSVRCRIGGRPRLRPPLSFRPWQNPFREKVWGPRDSPSNRDTPEDLSSRTRPGGSGTRDSNQRDAIRHRARHVLLLMVDSLTQFFENDTFTRTVSNENLQERISNLISLLGLALNLTDLLLTQLDVSSSRNTGNRDRLPTRNNDPTTNNNRHSNFLSDAARRRPSPYRRITLVRAPDVLGRNNREEAAPAGGPVANERVRLPVLRVNDGPPPPDNPSNTLRESPPPAIPIIPHAFQRHRFLHPRYRLPAFVDDSSEDSSHERNDLFFLRATSASMLLSDTPMAPHHRIQAWDFSKYALPEIHIADKNIVVSECKIHNDASVDISNDGKLLVSLLPSGRLSITTMLGVYSLQWDSLGQCLYTTSFEQNAVSVSLSPTTRHLIVGLASRRVHFFHTDRQTIAQIFRLEGGKPSKSLPSKGRLVLVRELDMSRESTDFMSLNCIRWAPTPGEAFVYGTNTGKLKILR